jgi:hypothetical protein
MRAFRFIPALAITVLLAAGCGEEAPAPAKEPLAEATTPPAARTVTMQVAGAEVEVMLPEAPDMTAFGRDFMDYQVLRDAAIREYLAQRYDEVAEQFDLDAVRAKFEQQWPKIEKQFAELKADLGKQRQFMEEYLAARKADGSLSPETWFAKLKEKAAEAPFTSSVEWKEFAKQFPSVQQVDEVLANFPQSVEEAWNLKGSQLTAEAFGEFWVMEQIRLAEEDPFALLSPQSIAAGVDTATADAKAAFDQMLVAKSDVIAMLRDRLALANVLPRLNVSDPRIHTMFQERARDEVNQPLPGNLEEAMRPSIKIALNKETAPPEPKE